MTTFAQRSFAAGELTPSLYGRVDFAKYAFGLKTCRNFIIRRQGGAANRPGTIFLSEVKDNAKEVRLIPFVFNAEQTYVLEFGDQYIRFFQSGGQVELEGVTSWSGATAYTVGDLATFGAANYYCKVAHTNHTPPNTTYWHPMVGNIFEIPSPYLEADLFELQYVQSGDIITIVHPDYAPRELSRFAATDWTLTEITFGPTITAPTNLVDNGVGSIPTRTRWVVTAVGSDGEESLASNTAAASSLATAAVPIRLTWTAVAGAVEYRIYKQWRDITIDGIVNDAGTGGLYGLLGIATTNEFNDVNQEVDLEEMPPTSSARNPFSGAGNWPATVTYSQQRLIFANTNNDPEGVWASRIGSYKSFERHFPLQDDDSINFRLTGRQVNAVRHLVEIRQLLALTSGSEWSINGDEAGVLRPTEINAKQQTYNGSATLPPLNVGGNALYVQARGSVIRDIGFDYKVDGYNGNDLTTFSTHLFEGKTLVDWAYQQIPDSIVWAVRSDGILLGMTYLRDQEIIAWHRHDFDGTVESVCTVPEGNEDRLYLVIRRTVDGQQYRYVEEMASRQVLDIEEAVFADCALQFDGTHDELTLQLTNGTTWDHEETLTCTLAGGPGIFGFSDAGNEIILKGSDGVDYRLTVVAITVPNEAVVRPVTTVPAEFRNVVIPGPSWAEAVRTIGGLNHLEGKEVVVVADGYVIGNPNNSDYPTYTVSGGAIDLDRPYDRVLVGLPIIADLETLNIDTANGESIADKKKLINSLTAIIEGSRGLWAGPRPPTDDDTDPLENLQELKIRNAEGYNEPIALKTGEVSVPIQGHWNTGGRVFIRQIDPLPLAVLSIMPAGLIPFPRS